MRRCIALIPALVALSPMLLGVAPAAALDPAKSIGQYVYDAWGVREGLPVASVESVARTPDGYLWVATESGLLRFDGVRFTPIDRRQFPDLRADIHVLLADRTGILWVGTNRGLVRWHHGRARRYTTADGLAGDLILCLFEDREGAIWIGTRSGVSRLKDDRAVSYTTRQGLPHDIVQSIAQARDGTFWIATNAGLAHLSGGTFTTLTTANGLASDLVQAVHVDRHGVLWAGTFAGLHRIADGRITRYTTKDGLSHDLVDEIVEDEAGSLWLATYGGGVSRFRDGRFERFTTADGLSADFLHTIVLDRDGSLWIAMQHGGLGRLRDGFITPYTVRDGLPENVVRSVLEDRTGAIWIGTHGGGLTRLDHGRFTTFTTKDGLPSDIIFALAEAADGRLWVGAYNGGLSVFDRGRFRRIESDQLPRNQFVTAMQEDRTGAMWVGTNGGGLKRILGDAITTFTTRDGLAGDYIWTMTMDARGVLWVGTSKGLTRYADGRFTSFTTTDGLPDAEIYALLADIDGSLWVASTYGGLSRMKDGRITSIEPTRELLSETVFRILADDRGYLWCSSNLGLHRLSRQELHDVADGKRTSLTAVRYGTADGMKTAECNGGTQPAGWRMRDGRLWFPTPRGVVVIDPSRVHRKTEPPQTIVEEVIVDGRSLTTPSSLGPASGPPNDRPLLTAAAGSRQVEFHYSGPYLSAPERVHFRYRLDGYDADWVDAGTRRVAYYTDLPPGVHRFRVTAAIDDGPWRGEAETTGDNPSAGVLPLRVAPHFYQTWWFAGAVVFSVAGALWGAHRYRVNQLLAVERVRTRIASDLHDDIGSSLSQIAILSEVVRARIEPASPDVADPLARIGALSRESVDAMGDIVWAISPHQATPMHLSQRMRRLASDLLPARGIQLQFESADEGHARLGVATRREVFLIFKEALHNIVRHANATEVSIALTIGRRALHLVVKDNGTGFETGGQDGAADGAADSVAGQGLRSMTHRAEAIGGRLAISSTPGGGTSLALDMPIR